jgi:hypothetical protein
VIETSAVERDVRERLSELTTLWIEHAISPEPTVRSVGDFCARYGIDHDDPAEVAVVVAGMEITALLVAAAHSQRRDPRVMWRAYCEMKAVLYR